MKLRRWALLMLLLVSAVGNSFATPIYQTALITRMRMVPCIDPPRRGGFVADILVGSGPATAMAGAECPEYDIEAAKVFYRIRPRRDLLLPVGETIRFRLHKRDLLVLTDDADKELVFRVIQMTLRTVPQPPVMSAGNPERASRKCLTMEGDVVACSPDP